MCSRVFPVRDPKKKRSNSRKLMFFLASLIPGVLLCIFVDVQAVLRFKGSKQNKILHIAVGTEKKILFSFY